LLGQGSQCSGALALSVHVLVNNCFDETAEILRKQFRGHPALEICEVSLLAPFAHAGGARRLAMDMAAEALSAPDDLVLSTDADTVVAPDWLTRMLPYFDAGCDAVAGRAILRSSELAKLTEEQRRRLLTLRKYQILLEYLRRFRAGAGDAWPNHAYEGGASLALTLRMYRAAGGCPVLPVGEDRALFDAVRRAGGRVRHATDVKVYTSGRTNGRAVGGMADTIGRWLLQAGGEPIHETWPLNAELGHVAKSASAMLTFDALPAELARAQNLAQASRGSARLEMSA
jgi:hypothetical protein